MLKGITVVLHERIENGKDAFNRPVYTENDVAIKNVLVAPASEEEILDTLNLTEEQREIIEEAFEAQSAAEAEYATESYFCGIADCIRFLKYIEGPRGE